jgi:hypothetical protein
MLPMKLPSLVLAASLLSALGVSVFACSTAATGATTAAANGDCPTAGSRACPSDAPIAQDDVNTCIQLRADATCGAKWIDYLKCAGTSTTCGADGKTDEKAFDAACGAKITAHTACQQGADAGGGG